MNSHKSGFTMIEALLSSLILAVGAVVICGLSQRCTVNNVRGWEYEQAYRLLDECLDTVASGQDQPVSAANSIEGNFGDRYPNFRYQIDVKPTTRANLAAVGLYEVTGIVDWDVGGQKYQVQATTLIYDL
ncbi:MAG: type II secretion system protein [Sedimentisphaerales bacterium]|nr:type II secretion system protein [Sedimentisphaerales bacterium]